LNIQNVIAGQKGDQINTGVGINFTNWMIFENNAAADS